eukprot:TRINITY_DN67722_c1_g4_i1.p2 TRINITY_DN67722_c1_g4~~TRINITY_DN67722_c1_g4_i1.p2  ORF type:complete len:116 (-),score=6.89 TRINITY_DN67722_c1_g4_i1:392-739(-)
MGNSNCIAIPSNDFELAIRASKELEYVLESHFAATGRGLHDKISSAAAKGELPRELIAKMRFLATIRNKLIHERDFNTIPDRKAFVSNLNEAHEQLLQIVRSRKQGAVATYCLVM